MHIKIDNDNEKDLDIVISMYNVLEKMVIILWHQIFLELLKCEIRENEVPNADNNRVTTSKSIKHKTV